jgi:hypothetical protein
MHAADSKEVDPPLPLDGLSWRGPRPQELDAVPRREFGGPMYEVPPDTLGSASGRNQDFVDLKSYAFSYFAAQASGSPGALATRNSMEQMSSSPCKATMDWSYLRPLLGLPQPQAS